MIETKESKKISNEELVIDIENTRIELDAVSKILDGYHTLSTLPENRQSGNVYRFEIIKFENYKKDCSNFLDTLLALFKERKGIKE